MRNLELGNLIETTRIQLNCVQIETDLSCVPLAELCDTYDSVRAMAVLSTACANQSNIRKGNGETQHYFCDHFNNFQVFMGRVAKEINKREPVDISEKAKRLSILINHLEECGHSLDLKVRGTTAI